MDKSKKIIERQAKAYCDTWNKFYPDKVSVNVEGVCGLAIPPAAVVCGVPVVFVLGIGNVKLYDIRIDTDVETPKPKPHKLSAKEQSAQAECDEWNKDFLPNSHVTRIKPNGEEVPERTTSKAYVKSGQAVVNLHVAKGPILIEKVRKNGE